MATADYSMALAPPRLVRPERQVPLLFASLALSWFLGLAAFFWIIVAFCLSLSFLIRRELAFPRRFGIWLLFLAWVALSAFELNHSGGALVFGQRYLNILAATVIFLWIFNATRSALPDTAIVNGLVLYWAILVCGGMVAILAPGVSFHTPAEHLVPGSLLSNGYLYSSLHARFADVQALFGFPVGRPMIFFSATNAWGAMVALLTPFVFSALEQPMVPLRRKLIQGLLVLSVVPIVVSLNRGMWIALCVAAVYVAVRFAIRLNFRSVAWLAGLAGVIVVLIFSTPLGGLIGARITTPTQSNESRTTLYDEAAAGIKKSPLLGHGGPRPAELNPDGPPVGTHSHLLFLAFSHGLPALAFFLAWFGLTFLRSGRLKGAGFWAHVALLVFFVESPYYLLEAHLVVAMMAAALIWRRLAWSPAEEPRANPAYA